MHIKRYSTSTVDIDSSQLALAVVVHYGRLLLYTDSYPMHCLRSSFTVLLRILLQDNAVHTYDISRVPGYAEILAALREEERLYKADIAAAKEDAEGSNNSSDSENTVDSATYDDDAAATATDEQIGTVDSTVTGTDTTYSNTQQVSLALLLTSLWQQTA